MATILGGTGLKIGQVLAFWGIWLALWFPLAAFLCRVVKWKPFQPINPAQKIPLVLSLYAIAPLALYFILGWYGLSWHEIGLRSVSVLAASFWLGFFLGLGSFLALFSFYIGMGWATGQWGKDSQSGVDQAPNSHQDQSHWLKRVTETIGKTVGLLLATLFLSGIVGFTEELVFRGFLTTRLIPFLSVWQAGAIASLIFALLHLIWDGKEGIPQLPGLWLMGGILTVAWWLDHQSIGLAWGLHSGWVWAIATVDSLQLIQYRETAPTWGIGINSQPLASVPGLVALMVVGMGMQYFLNLR